MKKVLKSILAFAVVCCLLWTSLAISAFASGTTSIAFSKSTLNVGDTLTVTIRFKATEKMYGVEAFVKYDTKVLQYVSAPNGSASASGLVQIAAGASDTSATETITFKAIGAGKSAISVEQAIYAADEEISMQGCSASVSVTDKSAAKSSDANLKYITPSAGSLTPKFSPNVTSYTITIPNSVTVLTVGAGTSHSGAEWDVEGSKNMKEGSNQRIIVVTAEDGTQKRYTLNITREAADGTTPEPEKPDTENPTEEKVSVTADGKDMVISNNFDTTNIFVNYTVNTYVYNGVEFPSIENGDTKLLYLTDANGQNGGFYRPLGDGTFEKFSYMQTKAGFYEFLKAEEIPEGYSEIALNIDNQKVTAYQSSDPALIEFALVYAKGPDNYTGFYRYDTVEHTLQRAIGTIASAPVTTPNTDSDNNDIDVSNGNIIDRFLALETSTKIIAVAILGIILLLIVGIIVLIVKIARPSVYEEFSDDEDEGELEEFDLISITDRDGNDDTV
ncbi:MAG: cadherin-like beta sandwich domain-containing protein [Clostridia bacterium]|nr:cadherin-like beta sandwich domain-containing protein [Clostridia bacterium]